MSTMRQRPGDMQWEPSGQTAEQRLGHNVNRCNAIATQVHHVNMELRAAGYRLDTMRTRVDAIERALCGEDRSHV